MKFGLITLPNRPWPELVETWRSLAALPRIESLWVADHLANPYVRSQPWFDGWSCLAVMARETERVRIGTLVSPLTFHNPARLVKAAVTLDHLSRGRIELAVGSGGSDFDRELAGASALRFGDFVARIGALLAREDLRPRPVQERIPLTVGGNSDAILRVAAHHADRWNTYVGSRLSAEDGRRLTRERTARLAELCAETGRSVLRSALIGHSFVAETPFRSREAFGEFVAAYEEAGIDELILYWPPEFAMPEGAVQPGVFEEVFS